MRLDSGRFHWPHCASEARMLTRQEYRWFMEGLSIGQPMALRPSGKRDFKAAFVKRRELKNLFQALQSRKRSTVHRSADFPEIYQQTAVCCRFSVDNAYP